MRAPFPGRRLAVGLSLALMALAGCRARDNDPGPGGVTVGEARALDEAAKMLESRPQVPPPITRRGVATPPAAPAKALAKH